MDYTEITVEKQEIYKGKILTFNVDTVVLPNGSRAKREIVHHPGGVGVVPVDDEGYVYMVRQFRIPYNCHLLEIPAGKLDKATESPELAARRELGEETGIECDNIEFIGEFYPSVGYTDEVLRLFLATGLHFKESHPDDDEFVDIEKYHISTLTDMVMKGEIKDGKTIAGILKAKVLLEK